MSLIGTDGLDKVFSALYPDSTQRENLSSYAMGRAANALQNKDYDRAVAEYKRAITYKPDSTDAYRNLGRTYVLKGDADAAIAAYKQAVAIAPSDNDVRTDLAKTYMIYKRYGDAEAQYKQILQSDANSAGARASLGYIYLSTDRLSEAETQFLDVVRLAPHAAASYYGLGQVYEKQGRNQAAVEQFQQAVTLKPSDAASVSEMGRAYFALGDTTMAQAQVDTLNAMNTNDSVALADQLRLTMLTPKILFADPGKSTFNALLGPQCPVALLDASLAKPNATKEFSLTFQFNQAMDASKIQDIYNWSITRASGGAAGFYNNGWSSTPTKEIGISPVPVSVTYDPSTHMATVYFMVKQNATGDGVMDPSHWVFRFAGTDVNGNPVDPAGDQYDGYRRIGF